VSTAVFARGGSENEPHIIIHETIVSHQRILINTYSLVSREMQILSKKRRFGARESNTETMNSQGGALSRKKSSEQDEFLRFFATRKNNDASSVFGS
jgi:hypothetical protein